MTVSQQHDYPDSLSTVIDEFNTAPQSLRLALLLDYAKKLPPLPDGVAGTLERVHECQTPLFLKADVADDGTAELLFEAPDEAPTTRGFASVIAHGLGGQPVADVMAVPDAFYRDLGLSALISPLRLRGMGAIVSRVKRQLAAATRDGA